MLKLNAGRIKTYILVLLIITSLFLCGSLWFENYHGFSTFLAKFRTLDFSKIFVIGKEDIQTRYEKIIVPSLVIVNNGEEGHWILYPSGSEHHRIWEKGKLLLKNVINDAQTKAALVDSAEWDSLITKSSIIMNFNYPLRKEIISMLYRIDEKKIKDELDNVNALAAIRLGQNIIFYTRVFENGNYIFRKYYSSSDDILTDKDFQEIFDNTELIKYISFKEAFSNLNINFSFEDNVFIPIFSFSDSRRKSVKLGKVEFIPELSTLSSKKTEELVEKFFEGKDYSKFIKKDGTYIFIDENNNTLRICADGAFEFEQSQEDKTDFGFKKAINSAFSTIEKYGGVKNLFISGIEVSGKQIIFRFDYAVNGIPINCSRGKNSLQKESAVEITITPEQLKYKRFCHEYKSLEGENDFSSDHDSIINAVFENAGEVKGNIEIKNIRLEYIPDQQEKHNNLPVWVVNFETNGKTKIITVDAAKDRR